LEILENLIIITYFEKLRKLRMHIDLQLQLFKDLGTDWRLFEKWWTKKKKKSETNF